MARAMLDAPRGKPLFRAPAVQAALIQFFSFLLVLAFAHGISLLIEFDITVAAAALLQGVIAALISRLRGLALWWLLIQAAFPAAVLGTLSFHLPPGVFLAAFVALLALYWSTFRTQVPFYPSGPAVWDMVASLLPADRPVKFIDIGSGLGGLVLHLSGRRMESSFTGIEIAPLPWLASMLRSRITQSNARFIRGDYDRLDFASYDVVFAYLSPAAMPALWRKASTEMRTGSLLLNYEFVIPGVEPHFIRTPVDGGPLLYGWRI